MAIATPSYRLFPVGVPTHYLGLRRLFDLSSVLLMLECRPGDRVLDLGAGSGFSSEMLARFGYHVIVDRPRFAGAEPNRQRPSYDPTRIDGTVNVVGSLAEALPLTDNAFDGIVGLNVLHHVPDVAQVTRELARVLRPGGRAVFCEPGLEHLDAPGDQARHCRTRRERSALRCARVSRGGSHDRASRARASRRRFTRRSGWFRSRRWSCSRRASITIRRSLNAAFSTKSTGDAFAMLEREGARERTSRFPGILRREIAVDGIPARLVRGRTYRATARVKTRATRAGSLKKTRWAASSPSVASSRTKRAAWCVIQLGGRFCLQTCAPTALPSSR